MRVEPLTLDEIGVIRRALPSNVDANDPTVRLIATVFARDFRIGQLESELAQLKVATRRLEDPNPPGMAWVQTERGVGHYVPKETQGWTSPHVVLCRGDREEENASKDTLEAPYHLATRTVFENHEAARLYAATIATSRDALVVPMPLADLRVGEDRGRLVYWQHLGVLT